MTGRRQYRFLEHVTDALIESYGNSLEEAFENAALGLMDTILHLENVKGTSRYTFEVEGRDDKGLLYNWLETVLIRVSTDLIAYASFKVRIYKTKDGVKIWATALGETLDPTIHHPRTEVKSPTYHLMRIYKERDKVNIRFLLDL